MLIQLPWAVSTFSHPTARLIKQIEKHSSLHRGFKNSASLLNITEGGRSKVLPRGLIPVLTAMALRHCGWGLAVFGHWCRLGSAPVPLPQAGHCCCWPPHDAFYLYFIDLLQELEMHSKYFSETWCYGGLEEKSLRMQSGDRDGEQQLAPPRPTPLPDSHHQHNTPPLTHC